MRFRLSIIASSLLLLAQTSLAKTPAPCALSKSRSDNWVAGRVNSLVTTARAAYESDDALPAYHRVLDGISHTLQRCKLSEDADFVNRHREFVEYVATISLDRKPDHELGFNVP
ncbi:MAG TPA: hypothetical protein VE056_09245, partial [Pyrinomonadaceae bacterium]|nr:hypothetical protein [Pyrinomonadaceae bacterium]